MYSITTANPADHALLTGLLRSERAAVCDIYDAVLPSIIHYVRRNSGTEADARDVFQDALLALYRRLEEADFALTTSLKAYLGVVCRNLWLKRLRKTGREGGVLPQGAQAPDLDPLMDARLERSEREAVFWAHFDALEEGCRRILRRFFAGESMRAIAAAIDSTEGYVKKRKHVCKERLTVAIRADARYRELTTRA